MKKKNLLREKATMNLYKHVVEQPFVMATGVAALVHSTWSLGTLFSGNQPEAAVTVEFIGWLAPAFLIAFALDVGQIATSAEIRAGHRTRAKYATFAVFAVATYYLQWLYIAHHMPYLELAGGVRGEWSGLATLVRDAAVWIIPAFLPLSTLMYTFSSDHAQPQAAPQSNVEPQNATVQVSAPVMEALPAPVAENEALQSLKHLPEIPTQFFAECPSCGMKKEYPNAESARRGLSTHLARWCPALHPDQSPVFTQTNGNGNH
jgi:hypothetical protein